MSLMRHHLFYIYQAFRKYGMRGFTYLVSRYVYAPRILKVSSIVPKGVFQKNLSIHMLVCKYDYLTGLWGLATFLNQSHVWGEIYIHNDGTLSKTQESYFKKLFPEVKIVNAKNFMSEHGKELEIYPTLFTYRSEADTFQAKKLIDTHFCATSEYVLVIDPDVLWFTNPTEIESVLQAQGSESYMMNNGSDSLCYVTFNDGTKITDELAQYNSGIVLYKRTNFDVKKLEEYISKFDATNKHSLRQHFLEQAGFAYVLSNLRSLPETKYIIKGKVDGKVVSRHYTGPSRAKFFLHGIMQVKDTILHYVRN